MTDDNNALEERVKTLEHVVQALTARLMIDGQVSEFLLSFLFFEKGAAAEEAIKQTLRNAKAESKVKLSDASAVWWSDAAVPLDPVREALIERVERQAADLRRADGTRP